MNTLLIKNVRIVTPVGVIDKGNVYVKNGIIENISYSIPDMSIKKDQVIEGSGRWLIPGIIDIHNDAIEKELEPRPNAVFPLEIALFSLESRLACHGVTSIYHSLSFIDGDDGIRNAVRITSNVHGIQRLKKNGLIRHYIHARYDITEKKFCPVLVDMIESGMVQMLSFMDHTPGQGQYKKIEEFERFVSKYRNLDLESVRKLIESRQQKAKDTSLMYFVDMLCDKALKHGIPIASHDDDSKEKVAFMKNKGVTISEFPIDIETAEAAYVLGQYVVVGAPNIIRGVSNSGNMRAIEAVEKGYVHILCSDYLPSAILHAVFLLHKKYGMDMHEAVNMATINPARAVGIHDRIGAIEEGKEADVVLVNEIEDIPFAEQVFVKGRKVVDKLQTVRSEMCLM